jgi:hypothetical protein
MPSLTAYWAYEFTHGLGVEALGKALDAAGPWKWELRDSGFYGDYLNCRPVPSVRVRIHEFTDPSPHLCVLLQIEEGSPATRAEIDAQARAALAAAAVTGKLKEIEPYD